MRAGSWAYSLILMLAHTNFTSHGYTLAFCTNGKINVELGTTDTIVKINEGA